MCSSVFGFSTSSSKMSINILNGEEIPEPDDNSLGDFFFTRAEKFADRISQIDGITGETETYRSLKLRSTRAALALQKLGVTSSDVVSFCSLITLDVTVAKIGTFFLGTKVAHLEPSLSTRHTKNLLSLVRPKVIFVQESSINLIEESLKGADFETKIIIFSKSSTRYITFSDFTEAHADEENFRPLRVPKDDVILIFFSSGTTGLPKAICHSHRTCLNFIIQTYLLGFQKALLHFTNFYWITASLILGAAFKEGSYRVFSSEITPRLYFQLVQKYELEGVFLAPILTYALTSFEEAHKFDTSSLKLIVTAGTSIANSQLLKIREVFPTASVFHGYGLTEVSFATLPRFNADEEIFMQKLGSSGRVVPGTRIKIVNPITGELLSANQEGEICIGSTSLMVGYYNGDCSEVIDNEGFLKTGDLGHFDSDGYLYITGRIKEMFKYKSYHIVPFSIETVILEHPFVQEVAVVGVPWGEDGEVPAACVVLKKDVCLSEKELNEFVNEKVADREKLRGGVAFFESFPKTPTGKIIRREVRDAYLKVTKSEQLGTK